MRCEMHGRSRALLAGIVALGVGGLAVTAAHAAPAAPGVAAVKSMTLTQSFAEPVRYRCVVRRCGPFRCFWVNRCRRW
jgi:hypothetical protein